MTPKQAELLAYIREYVREHEASPSYDEIGAHLGIKSKSTISRMVDALEERGFLRRQPGRARVLEAVDPKSRSLLAAQLAKVAKATLSRGEPRPGELEAALLTVLP